MKELNIQEKAKAYDKALKVLHKYDGANIMFSQSLKEEMFPALKESEDEKIRNEIIAFLKEGKPYHCPNSVKRQEWAVWVEKHTDKPNNIYDKELSEILGCVIRRYINDPNISYTEREKVSKEIIPYVESLEKQGEHSNFLNKIQIGDKVTRNKDGVIVNLSQLNRVAKPTNEEQKDILEDAILDGNEDGLIAETIRHKKETQGEQKSDWSEKDERMLDIILNDINYAQKNFSDSNLTPYGGKVDWLKSFKDRVQAQNLTVTDEELAQAKKDAYNNVLDKIEYDSENPTFDDGWSAAIWYLKKRNIQLQPKQEWNEEDDRILNDTFDILSSYYSYTDDVVLCDNINKAENWLKSIKERMKGE